MKRTFFLLLLVILSVALTTGQVWDSSQNALAAGILNIATPGASYTQNFNTLANTGTSNVLPDGWYLLETGSAGDANYSADSGTSTIGDTYSYGIAQDTDRAFGTLRGSSGNPSSIIGANFANNTGTAIGELSITYTGEEWRLGAAGRLDRLDFLYSLDAAGLNDVSATWIDVNTLDFSTPNTTGTGPKNGNLPANQAAKSATFIVTIANEANFWIRWVDPNATNDDDGLAVDDFSITANDIPIADAQSTTTDEDVAMNVTLTATDIFPGVQSWIIVTPPAHGVLSGVAPNLTYTPAENYNGSDSFTFKVNDGTLESNIATVSITIDAVNDAPVLAPIGSQNVDELAALAFTASATNVDAPMDALTFTLIDAPPGAAIDPITGIFSWTPSETEGPDSYQFTVRVCDDASLPLCDEETINVTVSEVNSAPVLGAIGNKTIIVGLELSFTATATDVDIPANSLTFTLDGAPAGAVIDPVSGVFTWTPGVAQVGEHIFTVEVCDDSENFYCDEETITVSVLQELAITSLNLQQSTDLVNWTDVFGTLASGYNMALDPALQYEYLDVKNLASNWPLSEKMHPFYLDETSVPAGFTAYWDGKGVNASAAPGSWQAWMFQVISGTQPMFYLKVGPGPVYSLLDGLQWDFAHQEAHLRISGDYPLGTYSFIGEIEGDLGALSTVTQTMTFEALPALTALALQQSLDQSTWTEVFGSLASGYNMALDPALEFEFLDIHSLTSNKPLKLGLHPFYLDETSVPAGFTAYWDAKGVNASAAPGSWQAWMFQIISGTQPMFYLKVGPGPAYSLLDGLQWDFAHLEAHLRISGDYPLGTYSFTGLIEDQILETAPVTAQVTFEALPALTSLALQQSLDQSTWTEVFGSLASGYNMALDPALEFEFLDNQSLTSNKPLKLGLHPFYLDETSLPAGFTAYWDAKGVNASAAPGSWQAWMFQIISGIQPMFYLKVGPGPAYSLLDGLQWDFAHQEAHLRISGDYPLGTYSFTGLIEDQILETAPVTAQVTFEALPALTSLALQQSLDQSTWTEVFGSLASGYNMALDPALEFEFLDIHSLTSNKPLKLGLHPFYLDETSLPAGFTAYWDAKGVNASAAPGSWQAWMFQIISGIQPMFYLKVGPGPAYSLLDGLQWDFAHLEAHLRISGDYPLGTYSFTGLIEDQILETAPVTAQVTFEALPALTSLALQESVDKIVWSDLPGDITVGFQMGLDMTYAYQYLDIQSLTSNKPLKLGLHPFYLDEASVPAGFTAYWDAKGVNASAAPGSWQAWMFQIISGTQPMFYLKVDTGPSYKLVDGLEWDFFGKEEYLRVSTDYPLGVYTFTGTIEDQIFESSTINAAITFTRINHPPLALSQDVTTDEDTPLPILLLATDTEKDPLTFSVESGPSHGVLTGDAPDLTYTPGLDFNGLDSFTYKANDGKQDSAIVTVSITVKAVNDAPVLSTIGNKSVDELTSLTFTATATDVDLPANTLTFSLIGAPSGAVIDPATGVFTWIPTEAQSGASSFTIRVCDDDLISLCDEEIITVTVNEVNLAPALVAIGDKNVDEMVALTFTATAIDGDLPSNTLTFSLSGAPQGANITMGGIFAWTPSEAQGPGNYSFTLKVCDNGVPSLCDEETITVSVNEVATSPVAVEDAYSVLENKVLTIAAPGVLANDSDADIPSETLTAVKVSGPLHGTLVLNSDGSFTYTPDAMWNGIDTFTYKANDGANDSDVVTVTITVDPLLKFYLPLILR